MVAAMAGLMSELCSECGQPQVHADGSGNAAGTRSARPAAGEEHERDVGRLILPGDFEVKSNSRDLVGLGTPDDRGRGIQDYGEVPQGEGAQ